MPHGGPHYTIVGTNKSYTGMVVDIGGTLYTTDGGTLQGDSLQVQPSTSTQTGNNPVTRTFVSRVLYYRADGTEVPIGSDLHEHEQGQIMLGHDPLNMGRIVTRNRPTSALIDGRRVSLPLSEQEKLRITNRQYPNGPGSEPLDQTGWHIDNDGFPYGVWNTGTRTWEAPPANTTTRTSNAGTQRTQVSTGGMGGRRTAQTQRTQTSTGGMSGGRTMGGGSGGGGGGGY